MAERQQGDVEAMERDRPAVSRGQNVLAVLPPDAPAVNELLDLLVDRIDEGADAIQALVLTPDHDTASAVANAASRADRPRSMRALAITAASRGERLLREGTPALVAGTPSMLLQLVRRSALKLDGVRALCLAWADAVLDAGESDALEALVAEVPKDARRVVATARLTPEVEQLVERYARRPRRVGAEVAAQATPRDIRYVAVSLRSRPQALRRLLDDLDPDRAAIYTRDAESARELRAAGLEASDTVRLTSGDAPPDAPLVVLYDFPASRETLETLAGGGAELVALATPRQLPALRALAAGGAVRPVTLSGPGARARSREERLRDELRAVLADAPPARELLALEPLLDEYDGVELAAAALRLLELERIRRAAAPPAEEPRRREPTGTVNLFVSAGARDGITARDLVGAISGESGITSDRIGRIEVRDTHSIVEIAPEVAERVVERMTGTSVKGRRIVVRIDRERPSGGDRGPARPRSSGGRPPGGRSSGGRPSSGRPSSGGRPPRGAGGGRPGPRRPRES
jgi:ATP-dependent RNA helicase DeaD